MVFHIFKLFLPLIHMGYVLRKKGQMIILLLEIVLLWLDFPFCSSVSDM